MITLSTFQAYLSVPEPQSQTSSRYVSGQKQQLLAWAQLLPSHTAEEQAEQLEKVLTELRIADFGDKQRLKLTSIVIAASDRFTSTLRQHYIYETGPLNDAQLSHFTQVKSLCYLTILVYDAVIRRQAWLVEDKPKPVSDKGLQNYFGPAKTPPIKLAIAVYQALLIYQKLLHENALCYQKPAPYLWSEINKLYYLACQQQAADIDLNAYIATRHADNIHRLYCQICLHSLLNVRTLRRANMLLVQRLLPEWAEHMVATLEPQTETRVFVDLRSDNPPIYLTAHSGINPYEDRYDCLFIELAPLVEYLQSRTQALIGKEAQTVERLLVDKVWRAISYRYIQPHLTVPTKYGPKQQATIVTGFNDMHYHASASQSLISLIAIKELPDEQHPCYDTLPKKPVSSSVLTVETFDSKDALSHFRSLRLQSSSDPEGLPVAIEDKPLTLQAPSITAIAAEDKALVNHDGMTTSAPTPLYIMSLFLLCRAELKTAPNWSIGIVRWLHLDTQPLEVEWQVLGHELIACGLRLEDSGMRSQHFVPAFMIGGEDALQTVCSIIVPTSQFQSDDRVMMRLHNKQKSLRLLQCLQSTDEFSQYEVVQL